MSSRAEAHAGDSSVLLVPDMGRGLAEATPLAVPLHSVENPDEQARVFAAGGVIETREVAGRTSPLGLWRQGEELRGGHGGCVMMTRGFGDIAARGLIVEPTVRTSAQHRVISESVGRCHNF